MVWICLDVERVPVLRVRHAKDKVDHGLFLYPLKDGPKEDGACQSQEAKDNVESERNNNCLNVR